MRVGFIVAVLGVVTTMLIWVTAPDFITTGDQWTHLVALLAIWTVCAVAAVITGGLLLNRRR